MENSTPDRYEVLRQLALAGSKGEPVQASAEAAIRQAGQLVGLKAAAMFMWDDKMAVRLAASWSESDSSRETLASLENDLFAYLRKERRLLAAYMTFEGNPPLQSFTHPIRFSGKVLGAVIGIQEGERTLATEELFIEALSAALSLNALAGEVGQAQALAQETIKKERFGAVQHTAETVNHEINNPLTAILGNVQLLLMKRKDLDDDLVNKLKTIEISALKIRDVTQRLLRLTSARSIDYAEGTSMLDLSDEDEK
jgi:signal transduction histidine kinase